MLEYHYSFAEHASGMYVQNAYWLGWIGLNVFYFVYMKRD